MSGLDEVVKIQCAIDTVCPLYISNEWGAAMYALTFYPFLVTVSLFAMSIYINEFYLFAISIMLTVDKMINIALKEILAIESVYPGCGSKHGSPPLVTQHAILLETIFISYILIYKPSRSIILMLFVKTFSIFTIYAWIYIGFNTISQLVIGALIGFAEGICFQLFMYFLIRNYIYYLLSTRFCQFIALEDNLCKHIFE